MQIINLYKKKRASEHVYKRVLRS